MSLKIKDGILVGLWVSLVCLFACSTAQVEPLAPIPPSPPPYVHVPHPATLDDADVRALFNQKGAESIKKYQGCENKYASLRKKTNSKDELMSAVIDLVRADPVFYHWCFYSSLVRMEDELNKDLFYEERQKLVVDHYLFLVPVARAFYREYGDSRYLRLASDRYQKLSTYVFYRRVTATQAQFSDPKQADPITDVLNKYDTQEPPTTQQSSVPQSNDQPEELE